MLYSKAVPTHDNEDVQSYQLLLQIILFGRVVVALAMKSWIICGMTVQIAHAFKTIGLFSHSRQMPRPNPFCPYATYTSLFHGSLDGSIPIFSASKKCDLSHFCG